MNDPRLAAEQLCAGLQRRLEAAYARLMDGTPDGLDAFEEACHALLKELAGLPLSERVRDVIRAATIEFKITETGCLDLEVRAQGRTFVEALTEGFTS